MCIWLYLDEMSCENIILIQRGLFWFMKYECFPSPIVFAFMSIGSLIMTKTKIQFLEPARSKTHELGTIVSILQMMELKLNKQEGLAHGHTLEG